MALYTARLYYDTGFSVGNVPYSKSIFTGITFKDIDAIWIYQDLTPPSIQIKTTWDDIQGADYLVIGDKYYFITGIQMLNPNVAKLIVELDALTTIGINNLTVIDGWVTRRHVNDDTPFNNTVVEDWQPTEQLVLESETISTLNSTKLTVIGSTVDLNEVPQIAKTFEDATSGLTVTIPLVTPVKLDTTVNMIVASGVNVSQSIPNTALYVLSEVNKDVIQILRSLGIESALNCCYTIDSDTPISYTTGAGGQLTALNGGLSGATTNSLPYKWAGTINNNKVYSGQYNTYTLYSVCSGDKLEFSASQIFDNDTAPKWQITADPQPNGKPYARPTTFEGLKGTNKNNAFLNCVSGSSWLNTPIMLNGSSGSKIDQYDTSYEQKLQFNRFVGSAFKTAGAIAGTVASSVVTGGVSLAMAGNTVTGIGDTVGQAYKMRKNQVDLDIRSNLQTPETRFPMSQTLQGYTGNGFFVTRTRLSDRDTLRYDRYLTYFGYAVSEPLTASCFRGRQFFNYVKASDVILKTSQNIPLFLKNLAENQIENGVRIWHSKPAHHTTNPII